MKFIVIANCIIIDHLSFKSLAEKKEKNKSR